MFGPGKLPILPQNINELSKEEQKKVSKKGKNRIIKKAKEIRQEFSKAVISGSHSGSGKLVFEHYDALVKIWGGSATSQPSSEIIIIRYVKMHLSVFLDKKPLTYIIMLTTKNMFNESSYSTVFHIANSGGLELDENEKLSDYISRKGLLVLKICFILKSTSPSLEMTLTLLLQLNPIDTTI